MPDTQGSNACGSSNNSLTSSTYYRTLNANHKKPTICTRAPQRAPYQVDRDLLHLWVRLGWLKCPLVLGVGLGLRECVVALAAAHTVAGAIRRAATSVTTITAGCSNCHHCMGSPVWAVRCCVVSCGVWSGGERNVASAQHCRWFRRLCFVEGASETMELATQNASKPRTHGGSDQVVIFLRFKAG